MAISPDDIRRAITAALRPERFFLANLDLEWRPSTIEDIAWELFRGQLLDTAQSRERRRFEAWSLFLPDADEPLLSVKLDDVRQEIHVVRAIYSYAWEGYHAGDNVYLSREVRKWLREIVATLPLELFSDDRTLEEALGQAIAHAVYGLSRLPLTSVEAPLPAFSLGQLGYFPHVAEDRAAPMRSPAAVVDGALIAGHPWPSRARLLETILRAALPCDIGDLADRFAARWQALGETGARLAALVRTLFDDVALSPYTDFVAKTLAFLRAWEERGCWTTDTHADVLAGLLRQIARHLTAYDLVTFHHRGANYPDALLLDEVLRAYLEIAERRPDLFRDSTDSRLRRRALRQSVLMRCLIEGLPVPDLPTSTGENRRVLPPEFPRVPEEQITDPSKRRRKLFDGDPLLPRLSAIARELLNESLHDLARPTEARELGMALFLDRPLADDPTLLLTYEAFSRSVAEQRLRYLCHDLKLLDAETMAAACLALESPGVPLVASHPRRPGAVSLADAFRVADDFLMLRTTRRSLAEFLARPETAVLLARPEFAFLKEGRPALIVGGMDAKTLRFHDEDYRLRGEWKGDGDHGSKPGSQG